ncbi:MAG: HypC/HybG/HupF family hydrogenase formation chaperone [Candidatus Promineifilaceae bacterium]
MCLGIPGQITQIWTAEATGLPMSKVNFGGVGKEVCLSFTPEAEVGDYVMVHVGFAISCIDEEEAERTLAILTEMDELAELGG